MVRKRGHGEGNIMKRTDGRWHARYTVKGPNGISKRRDIYGRTRKEVSEKLTAALSDIQRGTYIAPSDQTLGSYIRYWLDTAVRPSVREATYVSYEVVIRVHLIPALGSVPLQELTPEHIESYKVRKLRERSARSVAYHLTLLRAALDQAVKWGYVHKNAAAYVDKPRVPRPKNTTMPQEELERLIASVSGDRLEALYLVAITTGLRRGELLALTWDDIEWKRGTLFVRRSLIRLSGRLIVQEPKSVSGRRIIKLPRFVLESLAEHSRRQFTERSALGRRWQDNNLVFPSNRGTLMEPRNLNRHFDKLLDKAGLSHARLHDIRHSYATLLESNGVTLKTLSTLLGHSTISVTADLYVHPYDRTMDEAADTLDRLFRPGTPGAETALTTTPPSAAG